MLKMFLALWFVFGGLSLSAAPKKKACNDLKISQCKKREDCSWIKSAQKKDGKKIKAYCRKK